MPVASYNPPKRGRPNGRTNPKLEQELGLERRKKYESIWSDDVAPAFDAKKWSGEKIEGPEAGLKEVFKRDGVATSKTIPKRAKAKRARNRAIIQSGYPICFCG